ncbi:hypothetical protein GCM10009863_61670 [Streptomyces axinellae]|uniref:Uncharacterized protein n=1 Tax=Streptomyces axinellae TaxID=552788 RepID=A0ABP6D8I7_9ACTN
MVRGHSGRRPGQGRPARQAALNGTLPTHSITEAIEVRRASGRPSSDPQGEESEGWPCVLSGEVDELLRDLSLPAEVFGALVAATVEINETKAWSRAAPPPPGGRSSCACR